MLYIHMLTLIYVYIFVWDIGSHTHTETHTHIQVWTVPWARQALHGLVITQLVSVSHSVQFSLLVTSNSLWPHKLQHARLPCPSPTPGTFGTQNIKSLTVSIVSPSIYHEVMKLDAMIFCFFECWVLSQLLHSPLSLSSRGFLVPPHFLP